MTPLRRIFPIFAFTIVFAAQAWAQPKVMASILPVHSLAAAIMDGAGAPDLIVGGAVSEHSYVMKPSDARRLQQADLIFWIGEELETFLVRPLRNAKRGARVIALMETPGLILHPNREGGVWESHGHSHSHSHGKKGQGMHGMDAHVWLSTANAKIIAARIAQELAAADPVNSALYQRNMTTLGARLDSLKLELDRNLATAKGKPFLVFHDAYQYFEAEYGLTAVGSVVVTADRAPGARRISEVRRKIESSGALCIFAEPQYDARIIDALLDPNRKIGRGQLDATGSALTPGARAYEELMRLNASAFRGCLG